MQTLTLTIPDAHYPIILNELKKYNDIKIEINSIQSIKDDIVNDIKNAVNEIKEIKSGKQIAGPALDFLNSLPSPSLVTVNK